MFQLVFVSRYGYAERIDRARYFEMRESDTRPYFFNKISNSSISCESTFEQQEYMLSLVSSLLEALGEDIELGEKDPVFGTGVFFYPKSPQQAARSKITYRSGNFKFQSITVGLGRDGSQGPWSMANFAIHPRNYPDGVFDMKLPKAFFSRFVFEKAFHEQRPNAALTEVNVFVFKLKRPGKTLTLQFDARPDVSSPQDRYPQSFHNLTISTDAK